MAQIKRYTVGVTTDSPTVVCSPTLQFTPTELAALVGASFKVQGDPIVYTIAGYTAPVDPINYYALTLSVPYAGSTNEATAYQIGVDFTPNLQMAEINAGDQDWADHLTQEVIRKLDTIVGGLQATKRDLTDYLFTAGVNCNNKIMFTPEGGMAVRLTNKTGAASVKGHVVTVYTATAVDSAVAKTVVNVPNAIGVLYESGIDDGAEVWVVTSGIADVYFGGSTTRGQLARTTITGDAFTAAGYALSEAIPSSPFATDKHFMEIGHVLASRTGEGLARVNLHFN